MNTYIDQIDRRVLTVGTPKRIVSLVPSITHLLYKLGLDNEVVGITRFCKFPINWKKEKTIIGGTKDIKANRIRTLQPDLILANKEENTKEMISELEQIAPVYVSDVSDLESNRHLIEALGVMLDVKKKSDKLNLAIQNKLAYLENFLADKKIKKTAYFIWKSPWMTVGGDTFIHRMLKLNKFENIYAKQLRYPQIEPEELKEKHPELILLSSEPYPFKDKHQKELQKEFPDSQIILVQGEAFTWFGAYLLQAVDYFIQIQKQIYAY